MSAEVDPGVGAGVVPGPEQEAADRESVSPARFDSSVDGPEATRENVGAPADTSADLTGGSAETAEGDEPELTAPQLRAAAETLGMLAAPTRLHLVWLLARHEYDVGSLARRTGASVAAVSQHLGKLRLAGLVAARREGRRQIYAVEDPHVLTLVEQIFEHIAPDGTLAPDPPLPRHPARGGSRPSDAT